MRFVQVLRQSENTRHEVTAYLHRRFADASGEHRRFFNDQHPQLRLLAQQQEGRRRSRQRPADNDGIVNPRVLGRCVHRTSELIDPPRLQIALHYFAVFGGDVDFADVDRLTWFADFGRPQFDLPDRLVALAAFQPHFRVCQGNVFEERIAFGDLNGLVRIDFQLLLGQLAVGPADGFEDTRGTFDGNFRAGSEFDFRGFGVYIGVVIIDIPDVRHHAADRFFRTNLHHAAFGFLADVTVAFLDQFKGRRLRRQTPYLAQPAGKQQSSQPFSTRQFHFH